MAEELQGNLIGVTCLFCGVHTPLHISARVETSTGVVENSSPRLSIVRCCECGKEASYLAHEIIAFKGMSPGINLAA